jgi:iron(III) transport system permease protein
MQFANAITVLILVICLAASLVAQLLQARVQKWKD